MDNHKIWRIVANNRREMEEAAPEGYRPVVDVFLLGRPEPLRLNYVETTRDPSFGWAYLIPEVLKREAQIDERRILVPEHHIERIELHLIPVEGQRQETGFSYGTLDDSPASSSDE
jgi:hypothetical protein